MSSPQIIRMDVVSPATVANPDLGLTAMLVGTGGPLTYVCGSCESPIAEQMGVGQLQGVGTFACAACGAGNRLPEA